MSSQALVIPPSHVALGRWQAQTFDNLFIILPRYLTPLLSSGVQTYMYNPEMTILTVGPKLKDQTQRSLPLNHNHNKLRKQSELYTYHISRRISCSSPWPIQQSCYMLIYHISGNSWSYLRRVGPVLAVSLQRYIILQHCHMLIYHIADNSWSYLHKVVPGWAVSLQRYITLFSKSVWRHSIID